MYHPTSARPSVTRRGWRRAIRVPIAAIAGSVLLVALAAPAWAHVEAEGTTDASGITTVTFAFTHGCAGSPTTGLKVQLPDGTTLVTPQNPTGWTSTTTGGELSWTGGSIPDSTPGEFVASMRIVGTTGTTIFLPTVQVCAAGQENWIEKTEDPEAENAAPRIVLGETVAPDTTSSTASTSSTTVTSTTAKATTATTGAASSETNDQASNNVGTLVLILVVAAIAVGGLVLYLRNRKSNTP